LQLPFFQVGIGAGALQGLGARKEGAIAKLYATEAAFEIAHEALQVHGGIGYTKDLPVERYFRDARFIMIGGGTSEIMRYIIQREVYGGCLGK